MFDDWRGKSPRPNLMEVKGSEAQGRSGDGGSERSVEQRREPMNKNRIQLGIPTVLDRFIRQTAMQVVQRRWDGTFSDHSYGFRRGRSAHQAVEMAQRVKSGLARSAGEYRWSSFRWFYSGECEPINVDKDWWWPDDVQELARAAVEWSTEMGKRGSETRRKNDSAGASPPSQPVIAQRFDHSRLALKFHMSS